jgi:membrane fusion protein (multidrug efflux system)
MAQQLAMKIPKEIEREEIPEAGSTEIPSSTGSEARAENTSVKRKSRALVMVPAAILLLAATTAFLRGYFAGWESTDDAQIDGYINPISSRVAGYITGVYVDDNQFVKAGTLLVQVDPKDYQVALDGARATLLNDQATAAASEVDVPITSVNTSSRLASAKADVINARAGISATEKQLAAARAVQEQAEANSTRAQDDLSRYRRLVEKQEISDQQYTQAVQTAKAASAAVDAARAAVQAAEDEVIQAKGRLDQAEAGLESAGTGPQQVRMQRSRAQAAAAMVAKSRAAVEQAQLNLTYTRIVAPVDGVVARRSAQVGQYVAPGQPLMAVVPLDDIWVTANFKETQLKNMRPGSPAVIYVDAYDRDYTGRVESIAGGTGAVFSLLPPENATGNYVKVVQRVPVRIRIDQGQDPEHKLRPGLSVEPKVRLK